MTQLETPDEKGFSFQQYTLAVEMADRVSSRRGIANSFYFTVSSAVLATSESLDLALASAAGMVLACTWWLQLRSYRNLNAAKWKVIGSFEEGLLWRPFTEEWTIVKEEPVERVILKSKRLGKAVKPLARYTELSVVEQVVPALFFVLFAVSFILEVM